MSNQVASISSLKKIRRKPISLMVTDQNRSFENKASMTNIVLLGYMKLLVRFVAHITVFGYRTNEEKQIIIIVVTFFLLFILFSDYM